MGLMARDGRLDDSCARRPRTIRMCSVKRAVGVTQAIRPIPVGMKVGIR